MLWFTARDTPNGEIEERGHRLDETAPGEVPTRRPEADRAAGPATVAVGSPRESGTL